MTLPGCPEPRRILVAGDWHGNTVWAMSVIRAAADLLEGEVQPVIVHLGDFGVWPGRDGLIYLNTVDRALARIGAVLYFVDGNHEDFGRLGALHADAERKGLPLSEPVPVTGSGRVRWLRRGTRWQWHGRTWLALGGAVSLDKAGRHEWLDWWPQEEITGQQELDVRAAGRADVMVTHECPARVTHTFPHPPSWWDLRDLARNDAHRERMQRIVDTVQPSHLMHGHLHIGYQRETDLGYGPVQVTGLDRDGEPWNYAVLDVAAMTWQAAEAARKAVT